MGKRGPRGSGHGVPTYWDLVCPLGSEKTARIKISLELNAAVAHGPTDMTTLVVTLVHHVATACHSGGVRYLW